MYKFENLAINDVIAIDTKVFFDDRGFFYESFNSNDFNLAIGVNVNFVQDNYSHSIQNVLRGLHFQLNNPQGKLIRVIQGEIYDVAVDLRLGSKSYGKYVSQYLSSKNKKMLWIPEGFAHGFLTLSNSADVAYKVTNYYDPKSEKSIIWNDEDIGIEWPIKKNIVVSEKDSNGMNFKEFDKKVLKFNY